MITIGVDGTMSVWFLKGEIELHHPTTNLSGIFNFPPDFSKGNGDKKPCASDTVYHVQKLTNYWN